MSRSMSLGKRRWMKLARKWRTPTFQELKEEKQSKPDTAGSAQTQKMKGVFVFGSAARSVTETDSSLPAPQELPSHQVSAGYQVKTVKKARQRSRFGKCCY